MTKLGTLMGWNTWPTARNISLTRNSKTTWLRFGPEWPWYLNDPTDHTSGFSTTALAGLQADIDAAHANGVRLICCMLGVPTSVNPLASTADGGWHYFPHDSAGRTAWKNACIQFASMLDLTQDILQMGNEIANVGDFNLADQSPAEVGLAIKVAIDGLRTAYPTLKILGPSLNPIGDLNATPTPDHAMPIWGGAMISANPTLVTSSRPNWYAVHTYMWGDGTGPGIDDPGSTKGWAGHVQADAWRQVLLHAGYDQPGFVITEMGEPSAPAPNYDESWQFTHAGQDYVQIDNRRALGWYVGPEIRHTLVDDPTIPATSPHRFFGIFRTDLTAKPLALGIGGRALTDIPGTGAAPVAEFSFTDGPAARTIQFTSLATGATTWAWDFDNSGSTDLTTVNPLWTYPAAGTYTAKLTVTNANGTDTITHSVVVVDDPGPSTWDYDSVALPLDFPGLLDDPFHLGGVATWDYDSALLAFDFPGAFDDPFGGTLPPVEPRALINATIDLGTVPIPGLDTGWFTLDTSKLDSAQLLAPDIVWHRLNGVVTSYGWQNGINEERGRPSPGSLQIVCESTDRNLDPSNIDGDYYPYIYERPSLRLTIDGAIVFEGTVEDVTAEWSGTRLVTTFSPCVDGWSQFQVPVTWTPTVWETSGARVRRLLGKAGYTGPAVVLAGTVTCQAGTEQSGPIVDQIADVAAAEDGLAYFSGGVFVFVDRIYLDNLSPTRLFFAPDGVLGVPFTDAAYGAKSSTWWPRASVKGIEDKAKAFTAGNIDQSTRHGEKTLEVTVPLAFDSEKHELAERLVTNYGNFKTRYRTVTFDPVSALSDTERGLVFSSGVGTAVVVRHTPPTGQTVESTCVVIGTQGDGTRDSTRVTLMLRQMSITGPDDPTDPDPPIDPQGRHYFKLDDPTWGVLDGPSVLK